MYFSDARVTESGNILGVIYTPRFWISGPWDNPGFVCFVPFQKKTGVIFSRGERPCMWGTGYKIISNATVFGAVLGH